MSVDLAYILQTKLLSQANQRIYLVNEDKGHNPYDNPGTHKETVRDPDYDEEKNTP